MKSVFHHVRKMSHFCFFSFFFLSLLELLLRALFLDLFFFFEIVDENSTVFSGISDSISWLELWFERNIAGKEWRKLQRKLNSWLELKISVRLERLELENQSKVFGKIPANFFCVRQHSSRNLIPLERAYSSGI